MSTSVKLLTFAVISLALSSLAFFPTLKEASQAVGLINLNLTGLCF